MVSIPVPSPLAAFALRLERGTGLFAHAAFTGLLASVYFLTAQLGFMASFSASGVTCVWPPSGLALASFLLYRWRALPGIVLGSIATNLLLFGQLTDASVFSTAFLGSVWQAFVLSLGSLLQAMLAARLGRLVLALPLVQDGMRGGVGRAQWRFVAVVMLSCCVACTFGVIGLASRHLIGPEDWLPTWATWWVGDTAGMLVVGPALLWFRLHLAEPGREAAIEQPSVRIPEAATGTTRPQPSPLAALDAARTLTFPIICMGIGLSMMAAFVVGHLEGEAHEATFRQQARTLAVALEKNLALSLRDLQSLQATYYKVEIAPAEFESTIRPLLGHHSWQRSFGWIPRVSQSQRDHFESGAEAVGLQGRHLREIDAQGRSAVAGVRSEYLPLHFVSPGGPYEHLIGLDLLAHGMTGAPLARSVTTGQPQAVVVRNWTPDAQGRSGLLMVWPVLRGVLGDGSAARHDPALVRGLVLAHVDLGDLLNATIQELGFTGREVALLDPAGGGKGAVWASVAPAGRPVTLSTGSQPHRSQVRDVLTVADFQLALIQRPSTTGLPVALGRLPMTVLLFGLGFTLLLTGYFSQRQRAERLAVQAHARLEEQVSQRTAELSASNTRLAEEARVRRQAEDALRRFHWFAESASQGLVLATFDRQTVYLNPSLRQWMRLARDAAVDGRDIATVLPPALAARLDEEIWPALLRGATWSGELTHEVDGQTRHLMSNWFVLQDEAGQPKYLACVLTDISARKRLEQDVERAREAAEQANQAKSTFLANMSHEIRTPLNAVLGYSQLMREDTDLAPRHRERLGSVLAAGQRLLGLINDVLDLSKIEAGAMTLAPQAFDLSGELRDVIGILRERAQARQLDLRLQLDLPQPTPVVADRAKLGQMLLNLLGNAIKFTDHGHVSLRAWHDGAAYCFEVRDTGRGMADGELEQLFTPFRQGEGGQVKGGTGLGLSITRKLARLMHGDLALMRPSGGGTVALLRLPLSNAVEFAPVQAAPRAPGNVRLSTPDQLAVMVVDDDEDSRTVLCDVLTRLGCEVHAFPDGRAAWAALQSGTRPALVFTDVRMPTMSGLELLAAVRADAALHRLPVIAVTASSMEHQRTHFLAEGFDDFVGKPYPFEAIYRALETHAGARLTHVGDEVFTAGSGRPAEALDAQTADTPKAAAANQPSPFDAEDRAALLALMQACTDGALIQVRQLMARIGPHSPADLRAAMTQAAARYDLESLGKLAQVALNAAGDT